MKRIIDIPDDMFKSIMAHEYQANYQKQARYETLINCIEDSTPLNEYEVGDLLPKYINALRKCAAEHEKDFVPTFNIRTSDLCNDTAKLLEQIHHQRNIFAYANDMEVSVEELRVGCEAEDCRSLKDIKEMIERKAEALDGKMLDAGGICIGLYFAIANDLPSVYPKSDKPNLDYEKCPYYNPDIMFDGEDEYDVGYCLYKSKNDESVLHNIRKEISKYGSIWVQYEIVGHTDRDIEKIVEDAIKQTKSQVLEIIDKYISKKEC